MKTEKSASQLPRVIRPGVADRVRHCSRGPPTVHYLTTGPSEPKEQPNPYALKELPKKERLRGYAAPTLRWRETASMRERLRVLGGDDKGTWSSTRRSHAEVERSREKFVRKKYQEEVRERTLKNILCGYITDNIKMKEENALNVQYALEQAQKEIDKASKSMAEFLTEEQKTCARLTKKLNEVREANKKRESQIENEKKKMSEVKLRIFRQNESLEKMRKCREFILNVAPDDWKEKYTNETKLRQEKVKDDIYKLKRALHNYKINCAGEDTGLEKVLEDFIEEYSTAGPPTLPYDDPRRVFSLFKDLELKSLRALHHNSLLKKDVEKMKTISLRCDKYFDNEKQAIDNMLKGIRESIDRENAKLGEQEELLKNLKEGPYKKMVASEDILVAYVLIKDIYEELIDHPREGLDTLEMLQEIGELYIHLNRKLEGLPLSKKKALEKQAKKTLQKGMEDAERAERRKKQIENMVKSLRRAREKPWVKSGRPLLFKTPPLGGTIPSTETEEEAKDTAEAPLVLRDELETNFQLVYASNHPGPGAYTKPDLTTDLPVDSKLYYPDLTIADTDEEAPLMSESEEDKEGKKTMDPAEEKKKVKRKKPKKIVDSEDSE